MKLEYLAQGSTDGPLIRLYDFGPAEAAELWGAIRKLASGEEGRFEVHGLAFVESVGGLRLVFARRPRDMAIVRGSRENEFECGFTEGTWENVAGLVAPFAQDRDGYQWLTGLPGEAALLLSNSATGEW